MIYFHESLRTDSEYGSLDVIWKYLIKSKLNALNAKKEIEK